MKTVLNIEDYTIAPYDKGIIIVKDGEFEHMAMPETFIQTYREWLSMTEYLSRSN